MDYETTPIKPIKTGKKKDIERMNNKQTNNELKNISTFKILSYLIIKHKFTIVSTYAVFITILYVVPTAPQILLSFMN
jgi:hypothetical protein